MSGDPAPDLLDLLDWRRRTADLYAEIRATSDRQAAWQRWGEVRAELFRRHPQSPVPPSERSTYSGPHLYQYDPAWSTAATVRPTAPRRFELRTSQADAMAFTSFGHAHFIVAGIELGLELYWLEGYGGGLFVPFADATSGLETYGAGRYVLDSVKGADLGHRGGLLVLDFNFAYQPSCSYDPRWACPLAPPANRLPVSVRAGERYTQD